ncbi:MULTISPECIES: DUF3107 domain-containing protein [Arthrobacter]|uniref:DUF3107 domain-containing protein n=2 Tax=Arthrobacter TaxID=1663 RepID=A0ABU9KK60_9MICC|nr:DUF3107 domain-containing protein [Arthrobacter sp. YJM1]MDP5227161.1 DUF3107 domain-containing protein [Arthrobacter sp. YJM1]
MEVKIGIQNVAREIVFESSEDAETITKAVSEALASGTVLSLKDAKGRSVIVPGSVLGYVEVGPEEERRVGFGAL